MSIYGGICPAGSEAPVLFAAAELSRCLGRMTGRPWPVDGQGALRVGTYEALGMAPPEPVEDPRLDDEITVDVSEGAGIVAGINPRSVLLAAYAFLTQLGCRWVRPGDDGERIPQRAEGLTARLQQRPAYRHRGCCIEGAVSRENVLEFIDWLPPPGHGLHLVPAESPAVVHRQLLPGQGRVVAVVVPALIKGIALHKLDEVAVHAHAG
jgi:hypothetical protein